MEDVDIKLNGVPLDELMEYANKKIDDEEEIEYRFNEGNTIEQIKRYVDSTYERHYGYGKYQATDMIIDAGYGEAFCIGNIMKYAIDVLRILKQKGKKGILYKFNLFLIITIILIAIDLITKKIAIEVNGAQHNNFNKFFHANSRINYLNSIKSFIKSISK